MQSATDSCCLWIVLPRNVLNGLAIIVLKYSIKHDKKFLLLQCPKKYCLSSFIVVQLIISERSQDNCLVCIAVLYLVRQTTFGQKHSLSESYSES